MMSTVLIRNLLYDSLNIVFCIIEVVYAFQAKTQ